MTATTKSRLTLFAFLLMIGTFATIGALAPLPLVQFANAQSSSATSGDVLDAPGGQIGSKTASAGTEITGVIGPFSGRRARITQIMHIPGATTHNAYAMIPQDSTTAAIDAAAGQATITLTTQLKRKFSTEQAPASGDWVVFQLSNGKYVQAKVSSMSSLVMTLSTNVDALYSGYTVTAGNPIYFYGPVGDHAKYTFITGSLYTVRDEKSGLATTNGRNEPALVVVDNPTNAGNLIFATGVGVRTP